MKTFQYFKKLECQSIGKNIDVTPSEISGMTNSGNNHVADMVRSCCLYILIFILTCHAVFGAIKNGYERNIEGTKESLKLLRTTLLEDNNISGTKRRKIQATIETLVDHIAYYDLTEGLLTQFRIIAPELYAQVDTISDRLGRPVDVYVKFIPVDGTSVKAWGLTYLDHTADDKDAHQSEYGEFTVSVKVWIVRRALLVLAHELGHVKYQVPNLANYYEFHKKHYENSATTNFGHDMDDPSGQSAIKFGKTFQKKYADFIKISSEKLENPLDVLVKLKKNWTRNRFSYRAVRPGHETGHQPGVASNSRTQASPTSGFANDKGRTSRNFNILF